MTADLRDALVAKLNSLPLAFHDRNQVGMLMSREVLCRLRFSNELTEDISTCVENQLGSQ